MKFAIVGGDERLARLSALLLADGHRVSSFALELARLPKDIPKAGCLQGCVYGADCVVLPVPAEKGGLVNTPLGAAALRTEELISSLWQGQRLFGGALSDALCLSALRRGLEVTDLVRREDFAVGNAALTAEAAIGELISAGPRSLWRSRVLLCGWGRIGRILALRLLALGAEVGVAARSASGRSYASALGARAMDTGEIETAIGEYDIVVNTVPARVISDAALCAAKPGALLLELASAPGGFDGALAENIGLRVVYAPGLPGRRSPESAAELIRDAIYSSLDEEED